MLSAINIYTVPDNVAYGKIVTRESASDVERTVAQGTTQSVVSTTKNTETIVREYFADIPIMIQVARCESTFRHTLADGSVLRGVVDNADTGVMQINKRYHLATATTLGLDLEDIYDNMAYARYLYERQGVQPWNASRPCWGQTLAMNV
jgi:hypothetical protein